MMLYKMYFNLKVVVIFFLLLAPAVASNLTVRSQCGTHKLKVTIKAVEDIGIKQYLLYVQEPGGAWKLFYKTKPGMVLDAACVKNNQSNYFILFEIGCGGSAGVEGIYGVYNLKLKQILINPIDETKPNKKEALKVIGLVNSSDITGGNDGYFCCGQQITEYRWPKHKHR